MLRQVLDPTPDNNNWQSVLKQSNYLLVNQLISDFEVAGYI